MIRLFAALAIPGDIAAALAAHQTGVKHARWRDAEALHITLRFFGEVDERRAEDIASALALATIPPFELALAGVGHFGEADKVRALWAGVAESAPLRRLAARCETAARQTGCPAETRAYAPHLTLAYVRGAQFSQVADWLTRENLLRTPSFRVERFGLYASWPGEAGSRYELERFYPLH